MATAIQTMMMRMTPKLARTLLALLAAALAAPAAADRYRVTIGTLPPIHVDDARTYATHLDPDPGVPPRPPGASAVPPASPGTVPPAVPVPPDRTPRAVPSPQPPRPPVTSADPDKIIVGAGAGDPTTAFTTEVAKSFSVTSPEEVRGVWYFFQSEPTTLAEPTRMGNAVIRWMLAVGRAPAGVTTARPDQLPPNATSGKVRAVGGVPLRIAPWGDATGAILAEDLTVEIKPPANGAWYRVTGPGATGWAPGIWLELK